jgi:hypothetical protein
VRDDGVGGADPSHGSGLIDHRATARIAAATRSRSVGASRASLARWLVATRGSSPAATGSAR